MEYREFKIEKETNIYWISSNPLEKSKKVAVAWLITYPETGSQRYFDTLKEARKYIDNYHGDYDDCPCCGQRVVGLLACQ